MKFMNMKRFGSIAMAGALALSLAVPAFASGATPAADPNTTKVEGAFKDIEINVVVPESGSAQINPYGLPVSISKSDMTTADITNQKITSLPLTLRNQGTVKLDVNASLLAIPKGDVAIAAAKDTGKTIAVSLEVAGLDNAKYAVSTMDTTLEDLLIDAFVDDDTWAGAGTLAAPAVSKGAATGTAAKSNAALATLGAATDNMGMVTYGNDSIAVFRLVGDVAEEPVKADSSEDPWKETDGFTATIVFKFKPHQDAPSAGDATVTLSPLTLGADGNVTATFNAGTTSLTVASWAWSSSDTNVATVSGTTATGAVTVVSSTSSDTCNITATATLSNGATVTATAPCVVTVP